MFELSDTHKFAWNWANKTKSKEHPLCHTVADALVETLAEIRRLEWLMTHAAWQGICAECLKLEEPDPRHHWTLADWEREVRQELEGG